MVFSSLIFYYMYIRNDASSLIFFGITAGRPMTEDRSGLDASVFQIL
ncbi:hypothetical protein J2X69_000133 [Algoriphagus sp. 4150]|nr:hypothetical protein [Algoriphagus sp. 4150]